MSNKILFKVSYDFLEESVVSTYAIIIINSFLIIISLFKFMVHLLMFDSKIMALCTN